MWHRAIWKGHPMRLELNLFISRGLKYTFTWSLIVILVKELLSGKGKRSKIANGYLESLLIKNFYIGQTVIFINA